MRVIEVWQIFIKDLSIGLVLLDKNLIIYKLYTFNHNLIIFDFGLKSQIL